MGLKSGNLVVYKQKSAVIEALNGEKLEIRIEGGDRRSVRPKDVELLHAGPVAGLPPERLPDPDFEELLALMEQETLPFGEFLELAYGGTGPAAAWSAWLLLKEPLYFEGSPAEGVRARPAEKIAAALAARAEREAAVQARAELLERIRSGSLLPADRPAMREIEQVALNRAPGSRLLRELGIAPEPVRAHQLLCRLGVWDRWVDPWPARAGIELDNPNLELPALPDEAREDLTWMTSLAIDDPDSHDPDDAVGFADGLLYVHIADVAALAAPDSDVDREARSRGANLYLPETISHMLPPAATAALGLGLQPVSPALTFAVRIDGDGNARLERMMLSRVRVERLTYDGAAARMDDSPLREIQAELERFRARRAADGALFIDLPEVKVKVRDGRVEILPVGLSPVRELVANAMLAAGSAVGRWAVEREIPMPFAVQPEAEAGGDGTTLSAMFARRRGCAPSTVSILPGKHAGLGLEPYVRVTSPLRRYGDLLAHQQLRRVLVGGEPLGGDELDARIAAGETAAYERRRLERQCNEYWKLVYLAENPEWTGEAIPVDHTDDRWTFLVPSLAYEYKNRFGGDVELDRAYPVRIGSVDPVTMTCRLLMR